MDEYRKIIKTFDTRGTFSRPIKYHFVSTLYDDGMTYYAIAKMVGCPTSTIMRIHHRGPKDWYDDWLYKNWDDVLKKGIPITVDKYVKSKYVGKTWKWFV